MAIDERELDDSALVEAAQHGDHDAFGELFRRHYPTVRRVCARRLGNATEADEVAQAAFVRAFERLHQCEGERRFGAWVQVIAYNLGADARRHHARSLLTDEPISGDAALGPNHCEDHVLRAEQVAEVRGLLDGLPPRQREVIIARDLEGRRPGEIAASLGLSLGAVDSLLLRARRRMAVVWRTTGPEQGAATFSTTASLVATTTAVAPGPVSRGIMAVGNALASASYRVASNLGIVPGGSVAGRVGGAIGGAVLVGTLAGAPVVTSHAPATSPIPPVMVVGVQHVSVPSQYVPTVPALTTVAVVPPVRSPGLVPPAVSVPSPTKLPTAPAVHVSPAPAAAPVTPVTSTVNGLLRIVGGLLHVTGLSK